MRILQDDAVKPNVHTTSFVQRLTNYALLFSGQSTPWRTVLQAYSSDRKLYEHLQQIEKKVQTRLAPVFDELISIYPEPLQLLSEVAVETRDAEAVISVPGILFANYAALLTLQQNGLDIRTNKPVKSLGHSQGVLAATVVDLLSEEVSREHSHFPNTQTQHRIEEIFAIAHIIGAATSWATRRLGIASSADITPMLSIRGLTEAQVVEAIKRADVDSVTISIQNNTEHFVLSGYPHQLKSVIRGVEVAVEEHNKAIKAKLRGGVPLDPKIEFLQVTAPFHSPLLESAYLKTIELAKACGLDAELTAKLANHILLQQVNWFASVQGAAADGVDWLVNLGPGSAISNITNKIVKGTGVTVVDAGAVDELTKLFTYGYMPKQNEAWSQFKPKLIQLPDGKIVVDTKFTRLTGLSPIMLPGMTPTTVNAPIVAAAANAGHWAEMAGGGQYDAKVFGENLGELLELLEPGRAVQFNTMFFDRYIWGLQFGSARIVPKARVSGAPIDGVCISAGIPNMEEATEIITTLRSEGFKYISFKPGTADQIEQCVKIANASPDVPVIIQVEDGRAGGHHSWVNLDETLLATYELVRKTPNLVLCVGGGIGKPERAADYLTGEWSKPYGVASMPVDGVFVGTVAMTALEAKTNEDVKRVLVETPGLDGSPDSDEAKTNLWVGSLKVKGGVTSSLSHLHADMYELANASAECARLLHEVAGDDNAIYTRREEIIAALNKTAKPYFGDAQEMTYAQLIDRYVELCVPWVDDSWVDRFYDLLQRVEARFCEQQYGKVPSLFRDLEDVRDASDAITRLTETYPQIANLIVSPIDAAWFIKLCRKHPKPIPFVAAIDKDLLRAWGTDSLWQSHDPRYKAEQVRVIPGPLSVSGVKTMNEPIGQLLGRFEQACVERLQAEGTTAAQAINRVRSKTVEDFLQQTPHIVWKGKLIDNPAYLLPKEAMTIVPAPTGNPDAYDLHLHLDTYWDEFPNGERYYAVRHHMIPLLLTKASINGGSPIVDLERLPEQMYGLLSAMAGVHSTTVTGDTIEEMPKVVKSKRSPWGELHQSFTITRDLGFAHGGVTANELPRSFTPASIVPDAILGPSWPAIYGALGSGIVDDYPVIEGLLNAVHLDHSIDLKYKLDDLLREGCQKIEVVSWCDYIEESNSGRIVHVREDYMATHPKTGETILIAELSERFAVRGRVFSEESPRASAYAGTFAPLEMRTTARRLLRVVNITSPSDMTAFAQVSGDYNPIHTSVNAAKMVGLSGPLVHGMWLSAAAQHVVSAKDDKGERFVIEGWTYNMYGLVDLSKPVEISVERVGHMVGGGLLLEVTCRINKEIVSKGTARVRAKTTTYVFPGQGIQFKGMGLDERAKSAAVDEVWRRADKHTRSKLGFSILAVVRDNPTQLVANGMTYFHPDGLLYLTQFTQVALATVGYAQIERMREANVLIDQAYYAGHSLGEYNALSSYGRVISLETMLELVFHRGSTMHNLVPRDAEGRSNYLLGALRPNQFGMSADGVEEYITELSESTGEFLQIINYNLAGQQYAVAGTIKGLKMLEEDAARRVKSFGGKSAFMLVPGVDVPFHSTVLHNGVDEFRKKLYELLPTDLTADKLIDQYVPNLVARPFTLTKEFAKSILDVVPSEIVTELLEVPGKWEELQRTPDELARILLIELLCWQFASPVRWIETQELFFKQLGVEQLVEIGLKESPTLANLAAKTLLLSEFSQVQSTVYNVQRDEARIYYTDSDPAVQLEVPVEEKVEVIATPTETEQVVNAPSASPIQVAEPLVIQVSGPVDDLTFLSSDGMYTLIAFSSKIRLDQIGETDTMETLTNGVSSRRNQLLMDISAELGLPSIDGAAEATIGNLTKTVESLAKNYKPFGTMLTEATRSHINKWFGQAGAKLSRIDERVKTAWGLGTGWVAYVTSEILLGTREGASMRDGDLATLQLDAPKSLTDVDALIDAAVQNVAKRLDIPVALQSAGANGDGAMVDSAALNAFSAQVLGEDGVLANTAKSLLEQLGISLVPEIKTDDSENELQKLAETITSELGRNWVQLVEPKFDVKKIVLLDDRWASAKEDLARLFVNGSLEAKEANYHYVGLGQSIANAAGYWASRLADSSKVDLKEKFEQIASESLQDASSLEYANDIAIVTGATPDSIAGQVVQKLLSRGATVIMTASRINDDRLHWAKTLYREHANGQAKLWLVPANLSSYRDVDALIEWIGSVQRETIGGVSRVVKEQLIPTLLFPFAAPKVMGTMDDAGPTAENQTRLLLWSVEKLIAGLSKIAADTVVNHRVHTVLPGSPNRGVFGGDGAYGEVKAAFDAIVKRWEVEQTWASRVTLAHPKIGWVRGTGLMASNDPLVAAIEATGVKTYGTAEMADELLELCTPEQRKAAEVAPLNVDLTGGLGDSLDLAALQRQAAVDQTAATKEPSDTVDITFIDALPTPRANILPTADLDEWGEVSAQLEDMCVIVGVGEVGPWGSGRTRFEAEYGIQYDGSVELTPAGVLELAWMMNLLNWSDTPELGWYDQEGTLVDEAEIYEKYRDEVIARCGVRFFIDDGPIQDLASEQEVSVFLNRDITFTVSDKEIAKSYLAIDESHTKIHEDKETGEWSVTKLSGARVRVPRKATMTRKIGGQLPTNFNPAKWGIPQSMIESLDPLAIWNLVATVDAFLSSGFSPTEILQAVHPADVASTQGTGIGGTDSMRRLFVDGHLGEDRPSDILQETLPNVVAAHVMQSYVGGYGAMIHPVGACATAAVSVEEAVDKITCGKADFVVAGAIDDIGIESITGFGDMNATAKTQDLLDKGINPRFVSRANDRRRGGFVESEGGGTVLITRGDIALKLGLPVHGIVGYVRSFADGAHTSIPAPGLGALATARGGVQSKFVTNLAKLGVTPDDINVISKHDTSTNANDPNESELYTKLSAAIGRTTGNPLFVISQKTVVGHAKGGAAVFQVGGLCQLFQSGVIPANRSLDCVGEEFQAYDPIVWLREPLPLAKAQTIKAGLLTSLGFGHVSAMIAIVHPAAFERAVRDQRGMEALHAYLTQANQRLLFGEQKRNEGMLGKTPLFTPIHNRRFAEDAQVREVESEMLLDKAGRLNSDGTY